MIKTHKVIDEIFHEYECNEVFAGSYLECLDFVAEQYSYGYRVVPMTKTEIENYPDNKEEEVTDVIGLFIKDDIILEDEV